MLSRLLTEEVDLISVEDAGRDEFGNDKSVETTRTRIPAWVEPSTTQEDTDLRESQIVYSYWLFVDDHISLASVRRVKWRGTEYVVRGKPLLQPGGFRLSGFTKVRMEHEED